jgi:putative Mg2+ transporter-C (MgtC) family protein
MLSDADLIVLGRAALAAALGLFIGWEGQTIGSSIQGRTIGLAAMTAAALTALGQEVFAAGADRIVQGIVTGIGFLGAGVIIHGAGGEVRGLTAAAGLWAMTGIGVAIGSGHELLGVLLAALVYLIIFWGHWPILAWLRRYSWRNPALPAGERAAGTSVGGPHDATAEHSPAADEQKQPNPAV